MRQLKCQNFPRSEGTKPQASVILSLLGCLLPMPLFSHDVGSSSTLFELNANSRYIESCFLKQLVCQQWGNVQGARGLRTGAIFEQIITFVENFRLNLGNPNARVAQVSILVYCLIEITSVSNFPIMRKWTVLKQARFVTVYVLNEMFAAVELIHNFQRTFPIIIHPYLSIYMNYLIATTTTPAILNKKRSSYVNVNEAKHKHDTNIVVKYIHRCSWTTYLFSHVVQLYIAILFKTYRVEYYIAVILIPLNYSVQPFANYVGTRTICLSTLCIKFPTVVFIWLV